MNIRFFYVFKMCSLSFLGILLRRLRNFGRRIPSFQSTYLRIRKHPIGGYEFIFDSKKCFIRNIYKRPVLLL